MSPCVRAMSAVGDVVEVVADNVRLGADCQDVVADAVNQRSLPACGDCAEGVPGVAGDETQLGRLNPKLSFDVTIGLA